MAKSSCSKIYSTNIKGRQDQDNSLSNDQDRVLVQKCITPTWSISWTIKDFRRLVDLYPRGRFLTSGNFTFEDEITKECYDCRIRLFPNGNWQYQPAGFVALYLQATPRSEKDTPQGIFQNYEILKMELLQSPNTLPLKLAHLTVDNVEKNGQNSYGLAKFCRTESILANSYDSEVTIKITLFGSPINDSAPFEPFLYNDRFCDVEFRFECGGKLRAHKVILSARSKYFEKMFDGNKPLIAEEYQPQNRDDKKPIYKLRRLLTGLLNRLIWDNMENVANQIIAIVNRSKDEKDGHTLRTVIYIIFDYACQCRNFSDLYAHLCKNLMDGMDQDIIDKYIKMPDGYAAKGRNLFLKYLYTKCQIELEKGCAADLYIKHDENGELVNKSNEYFLAVRERKRWLGLARFFAELFKRNVITESMIHKCVKHCLNKAQSPFIDQRIDFLYELLKTAGKLMDHEKARSHMDTYFERMAFFAQHTQLNKHLCVMLMDLIELRKNGWNSVNKKSDYDRLYDIEKINNEDLKQLQNSDVKAMHIDDVDYKTFKRILYYFYTGKIDSKLDVE
ncbi:25679_t:CDS:2, partial [Gigaspora margarita]